MFVLRCTIYNIVRSLFLSGRAHFDRHVSPSFSTAGHCVESTAPLPGHVHTAVGSGKVFHDRFGPRWKRHPVSNIPSSDGVVCVPLCRRPATVLARRLLFCGPRSTVLNMMDAFHVVGSSRAHKRTPPPSLSPLFPLHIASKGVGSGTACRRNII